MCIHPLLLVLLQHEEWQQVEISRLPWQLQHVRQQVHRRQDGFQMWWIWTLAVIVICNVPSNGRQQRPDRKRVGENTKPDPEVVVWGVVVVTFQRRRRIRSGLHHRGIDRRRMMILCLEIITTTTTTATAGKHCSSSCSDHHRHGRPLRHPLWWLWQ